MGTENSRHFNVLDTSTLDVYAGATWTAGAHEVKFGADYADNDVYNAFVQNTNGNYTFGCEPGTYSFGTFTNCTQMTAAQRELAVLENFRSGKPSAFVVQVPQPGLVDRRCGGQLELRQHRPVRPGQLEAQQGVQPDVRRARRPAAGGHQATGQRRWPRRPVAGSLNGTTYTRATGGFGMDNTVTLDGNNLFQPRVGFNWNLSSAARRAQLRGGMGLFQGAAANVWLSNPFSNTGKSVMELRCASYTACSTANLMFSADPDAQPSSLTGTIPAANVDLLSPELEQPSVWKPTSRSTPKRLRCPSWAC
jgi:hypothetical protein